MTKRSIALFLAVTTLLSASALAAPKVVIVNMIVLQDDQGRGNLHWAADDRYTNAVFRLVNDIYASEQVRFKVSKTIKRSTKHYFYSQKKLLDKYDSHKLRKRGQVLMVISGEPYDGSSSGRAKLGPSSRPIMVVRSRYNERDPQSDHYAYSPAGIRNSAFLFTHELGHEMGLNHSDEIKTSKGDFIHTENYVYPHKSGKDGRRFYEEFFKSCLISKSIRSFIRCKRPSIKKKFNNPLPVPVTLPIFLDFSAVPYPPGPPAPTKP